MSKYSFVTVSNRLPINVTKVNDTLEYGVSTGGLATAMSALDQDDAVWVGWCGTYSDDLTAKDQVAIKTEFAKHGALPVFLTRAEVEGFYEGYSNDTLWPLFHYFQSLAHYEDGYWEAYRTVNQKYCEAVRKVSRPSAKIWIQDYQLMLLPGMIRSELPKSTIGFFLHIPFPSFEVFRLLPERHDILHGLLGADVIGFHIYDYGRHFMSSCERLAGLSAQDNQIHYDGRIIRIGTYPISVDYKNFAKTAASKEVAGIQKTLKSTYKNQRIILSVDRLDYTKGIPARLEAFRLLLEEHPEYIGNVCLVMIAVPSRIDVESYKMLRDEVEQLVGRINGTFGTADWAPISYQFQNRPFPEVVALYNMADIMLVTPIRDGMNLVAKEYVASKCKSNGVLVLSELAGAIDELTSAVSVNPNSPRLIATALHEALSMPKRESQKRLKQMQERVKTYDIQAWARSFVRDMDTAADGGNRPADISMTTEQRQTLIDDYRNARWPLIVMDYDGTLRSFVNSPSPLAALPSRRVRRILRRLAKRRGGRTVIVSGRPKRALQLWFQRIPLGLAAEHGALTRFHGKWERQENILTPLKPELVKILNEYADKTEGAVVEVKEYALVWHYRNVDPELAYKRVAELSSELTQLLQEYPIEVNEGNKILEVRQPNINKGHTVTDLMATHKPDFILCAGDDYTDEDMFEAVGEAGYSIKIGAGETKANVRFMKIDDLLNLLEEMAD